MIKGTCGLLLAVSVAAAGCGAGTDDTKQGSSGSCVPVEADVGHIDVGAPWVDGEQRSLEIVVRVSRQSADSSVADDVSSMRTVELDARDAPGGGWSMTWANQETILSNLGVPDSLLPDADQRLTVRYSLDEFGLLESVDNIAEIRTAMIESVALLAETSPDDKTLGPLAEFYGKYPTIKLRFSLCRSSLCFTPSTA